MIVMMSKQYYVLNYKYFFKTFALNITFVSLHCTIITRSVVL